jgi:hypothetical protein
MLTFFKVQHFDDFQNICICLHGLFHGFNTNCQCAFEINEEPLCCSLCDFELALERTGKLAVAQIRMIGC